MKKLIVLCCMIALIAAPAFAAPKKVTSNRKGRSLSSVCGYYRGLNRGEIYKSRQSPHIPAFDRRKNSTALIYTRGTAAPSSSCLNVYDKAGNLVHKMGIYARGEALYSARFYGGSGCGDAKSPSTIASLAKRNTKSSEVYISTGARYKGKPMCLKIDNPLSCVNSVGC